MVPVLASVCPSILPLGSWEGCLTKASRAEQPDQRGGHMSRQ